MLLRDRICGAVNGAWGPLCGLYLRYVFTVNNLFCQNYEPGWSLSNLLLIVEDVAARLSLTLITKLGYIVFAY